MRWSLNGLRLFAVLGWTLLNSQLLLNSSLAIGSDFVTDPNRWFEDPAFQDSLKMEPLRETAISRESHTTGSSRPADAPLLLGMKRYARPGAQPVLLIHGLAQNDLCFDPVMPKFSFARYLHAQGFDVWVANMRGVGSPGFRSEAPEGPRHWTVDDLAIYDVPALVGRVVEATRQKPFIVGHSMGAWALEGYFSGLVYDSEGRARPISRLARQRKAGIRGAITIAGVYGLWWRKSVKSMINDPIRSEEDFYHSNYELELLFRGRTFYHVIPRLPGLPLDWVRKFQDLPIAKIPFIGDELASAYESAQEYIAGTPILNMFYYPPNADAELIRRHGQHGLEDLGPRLVEQIANAHRENETTSYFHLNRPKDAFSYRQARQQIDLPMLFVAGGRDRLANISMVYQNGYVETGATQLASEGTSASGKSLDKQFLGVEKFGHLDILSGKAAPREVMQPVVNWMRARM